MSRIIVTSDLHLGISTVPGDSGAGRADRHLPSLI